jgi:hypothetical protein
LAQRPRPPLDRVLWSRLVRAHHFVCPLLLVAVAGCAHRPLPGPDDTVHAFAAAVAANRVDEAYGLMSAEYRAGHSRDAFARSLPPASSPNALTRLGARHAQLRAEVELGDGERLSLVQEADGWRFARDPLDLYPQRAPDEALRSFVRAIERKRWDVILRFIPLKYRNTITAETLQKSWEGERRPELLAQLATARAHLDEPIEIVGDEARLPLGERKQVKLLREDGVWKIETLE